MGLPKAFRRISRPFDAAYINPASHDMLVSTEFASDRLDFTRSYKMLEADLLELFDFIEPDSVNNNAHSHRLFQILIRACIEFEANAKAILRANNYSMPARPNITDYFRVEEACKLSEFEIALPPWSPAGVVFTPFSTWASGHRLPWYDAYNAVKHDRSANLYLANLNNAVNATAAVCAMLYAQFATAAFDVYFEHRMYRIDSQTGWMELPGSVFRLRAPQWSTNDKYSFDWDVLGKTAQPFADFPF